MFSKIKSVINSGLFEEPGVGGRGGGEEEITIPTFQPRVQKPKGCSCKQCRPRGQISPGHLLKAAQPVCLALRESLGGCLPQFGESSPWTRDERSGVKLRNMEAKATQFCGPAERARGYVPLAESWAGVPRKVGHLVLIVQQGLGSWAIALLSRGGKSPEVHLGMPLSGALLPKQGMFWVALGMVVRHQC